MLFVDLFNWTLICRWHWSFKAKQKWEEEQKSNVEAGTKTHWWCY